MEFLKNHYEKIILSAVLVGLVAAAVVLAVQAMTMLSHVKVGGAGGGNIGPKVAQVAASNYLATIQSAQAPASVNFDRGHKIFNPYKVLQRASDNELFTSEDFGVHKLVIQEIKPLYLRLYPRVGGSTNRPSLYLYVTPEYESRSYARSVLRSVTSPVNRPQRISIGNTRGITAAKNLLLMVTNVIGDVATDPTDVRIEGELSMDNFGTTNISLTMSNEWRMIIEYSASVIYPPENKQYPDLRVGSPMYFFNDTNTVMEIQEDSVTIKEESSEKRTTISIRRPEKSSVQMPQDRPASGNLPPMIPQPKPPVVPEEKPIP